MRHVALITATFAVVCACTNDPGVTGDAGPDVRPGDAGRDVDASPPVDAGGCAPGDVSSFSPNWVPPKPASSACTQANIDQYAKDCLDPQTGNTTACNAFQTANKACVTCLVTPESATTYGAAISQANGVISLNVGGCIALLSGDLGASGCGAKYEANRQCAAAACDEPCPIPNGDDPAFQKYLKCLTAAEKTSCKAYSAAVCPEPDAGAVAACSLNGASFVDNFKALAPIFCASGG